MNIQYAKFPDFQRLEEQRMDLRILNLIRTSVLFSTNNQKSVMEVFVNLNQTLEIPNSSYTLPGNIEAFHYGKGGKVPGLKSEYSHIFCCHPEYLPPKYKERHLYRDLNGVMEIAVYLIARSFCVVGYPYEYYDGYKTALDSIGAQNVTVNKISPIRSLRKFFNN